MDRQVRHLFKLVAQTVGRLRRAGYDVNCTLQDRQRSLVMENGSLAVVHLTVVQQQQVFYLNKNAIWFCNCNNSSLFRWLDLKVCLTETYHYAQHHGWYEVWKQIIDLSDPTGEKNAYKVIKYVLLILLIILKYLYPDSYQRLLFIKNVLGKYSKSLIHNQRSRARLRPRVLSIFLNLPRLNIQLLSIESLREPQRFAIFFRHE